MEIPCYYCGSVNIVKNGHTYYGKQRGKCKDCNRQFVFERDTTQLSPEQKELVGKLLLERLSLEGICRVLSITAYQLYRYMDQLYEQVPSNLHAQVPEDAQIELQSIDIESDELWSFVARKTNKQWVWVAQERSTRQIIAFYIGNRGEEGAQGLWDRIPEVYKQKACFYTDCWEAYRKVIPKHQHKPVEKAETNHIERFFCTIRQRCSRLVRKALSFSKNQERHKMAIRFFIAQYNLSLLV